LDASGATKKVQQELNASMEEKAEIGRVKQAKAIERRSATKQRLAGVEILENATLGELCKLTVRQLDQ
jgi:hypothetical protein